MHRAAASASNGLAIAQSARNAMTELVPKVKKLRELGATAKTGGEARPTPPA